MPAIVQKAGQVRVNIRSLANVKAVRREKRNGRDVVVVPSATLPDDVVMNSILYPKDEIAKSYKGLNRTPAPLGHPTINGKFVSASDPEGINIGWIGAWNENLRQEDGRVFLDKVIDVDMANRSEGGKAVLAAIDKGDPVHTSTGLFCMLEAANGDVDYKFTARDIQFDHDAILLDEDGAATPEQGVGMMVNAAGDNIDIEVINSALSDCADQQLDWAVDTLARALEQRARVPLLERMKAALIETFGGNFGDPGRAPSNNRKEDDMAVSDEQFKTLSEEVKTLSESMKPEALAAALGPVISNALATAVKPLIDSQEAVVNAQKAKDEDELKGLRETIVEANILDEEAASELTLNAARKLAAKAKPGKAAPMNGAFKPADDKSAFQLPKGDA